MAERSEGSNTSGARDDRETLLEIARQITGKIPFGGDEASDTPDQHATEAVCHARDAHVDGADRSFRDSASGMAICGQGRILRANPSFALAFGYPSPEALTAAGGLAAIFPADRKVIDPATVNGGTRRLLNATTRSRRRIKMPVGLHAVKGEEDEPAILIVLHPGADEALHTQEAVPAKPPADAEADRKSGADSGLRASALPTQGNSEPIAPEEAATGPVEASEALRSLPCDGDQLTAAQMAEPAPPIEQSKPATSAKPFVRTAAEADFLARVSHDIRTPLNSIIGFAQLMKAEQAGPLGNERYLAYAGDILESGEYALRLIDDLLIISRIEAGTFALNFASVDLNALIRECVAKMQSDAHRRRVFLRASLGDNSALVLADRPTLERIVLNLLNNAVSGTHPGGQVIVECRTEASGAVQIRVQDNGSGMSGEEIEQAMTPLVQRDTAPRPQFGNGLVLPLTKALASANQAEFRLESEPGRGTRIAVTFPGRRTVSRSA